MELHRLSTGYNSKEFLVWMYCKLKTVCYYIHTVLSVITYSEYSVYNTNSSDIQQCIRGGQRSHTALVKHFSKNLTVTSKFWTPMGDMKQVPYVGPTNTRCHVTQVCRPGFVRPDDDDELHGFEPLRSR
jgi:hypothetical protein